MDILDKKTLDADIENAASAMEAGGIILYPTDTVWGLGCDACNSAAVKRLYELKQRSESKSVISLVHSVEMLRRYVDDFDEVVCEPILCDAQRPTTVIFGNVRGLAPEVVSSDGSAAFRLTREAFSAGLCRRFGRPVVSTSANFSGRPSPAIFSEIDPEIVSHVDYVVGYRRGDTVRSVPSKIVKIGADGTLQVIRP